jgi:hypothetical protein
LGPSIPAIHKKNHLLDMAQQKKLKLMTNTKTPNYGVYSKLQELIKRTRSIASMAEPIFVVAKGIQKGFIFLYDIRKASMESLITCSIHNTNKIVTQINAIGFQKIELARQTCVASSERSYGAVSCKIKLP